MALTAFGKNNCKSESAEARLHPYHPSYDDLTGENIW